MDDFDGTIILNKDINSYLVKLKKNPHHGAGALLW
jgi:hypothetical protein